MTNHETDLLLKRIGTGDVKAITELYDKMHTPIYFYILQLLGNEADAEDVMQETFVSVIKNSRNYKSKGKAAAWIYTIAKNKTLDFLRKQQPTIPIEFVAEELFSNSPPVDEELIYLQMLECLNNKERDIVILRVICGFTLTEIAREKNLPKGSVFWSYNNAMKKLKKYLKEDGEFDVR